MWLLGSISVVINNAEYKKMLFSLVLIPNIKMTEKKYMVILCFVCILSNCPMGIWYQFTITCMFELSLCSRLFFLAMRIQR